MCLLVLLHHIQNLFQLTSVEEEKGEKCQKSRARSFGKAGSTAEGKGRNPGPVCRAEVQSHEATRQEGKFLLFKKSLLTEPELKIFIGDRITFVCLDVSDKLS